MLWGPTGEEDQETLTKLFVTHDIGHIRNFSVAILGFYASERNDGIGTFIPYQEKTLLCICTFYVAHCYSTVSIAILVYCSDYIWMYI